MINFFRLFVAVITSYFNNFFVLRLSAEIPRKRWQQRIESLQLQEEKTQKRWMLSVLMINRINRKCGERVF